MKTTKNQMYSLQENGYCHTKNLSLDEVNEAIERHTRFFPECEWTAIPMQIDMQPKMKGHFSNR